MILNRGDKQYTDIEKFKKYELTTCIAYEMAIRNDEVIKLVNKAFRAYIDKDLKEDIEPKDWRSTKYSGKYFKELRDKYLFSQDLYLKYHFFSSLWEEISELFEKNNFYNKELKGILEIIKKESRKFNKNEKDYLCSIKPINIRMLASLIFNEKKIHKYKDTHKDKDTIYTFLERDTLIFREKIYHIEDDEEEKITKNSIEPNYSRPSLFTFYKSVEKDIKLNLAMPKDELIDFIEKIKSEYDKNHKSIMSISELLGEELEPFRDMIFKENNNPLLDRKTKKQMRATSFTSNAFKMADILFIYDCLVLGYKKLKIKYLLTGYYESINKNDTIDDERYRRYVTIARDFIDNMRYKELFLGSSI